MSGVHGCFPFAPALSRLSVSLALLLTGAASCLAAPAPFPWDKIPWDKNAQGAFLTSLCADKTGHAFIATEGQGVWRFDPLAPKDKQYAHFTQKDGLGSDDVYALLSEANGRLWAGTLHGLSVYNGKTWQTYGPLEGPGGWRVFALAASPLNGDIWIATEGGLTRYSPKQDRWTQFSRLDGLPSDAVQCLAFDKKGDLFVGTQADGIAQASPADDYKTWRVVRGPIQMPGTSGGAGLPTSLINCLLVAGNGTIYAGTDCGLGRSEDGGKPWRFLRGADWADKLSGQRATEWLEPGLTDNADVRAIEVLPVSNAAEKPLRIAAGGKGEGDWAADEDFEGGSVFHSTAPIDTRAVPDPAPQSVYQSARWGSFTYHVPHLTPGASYRVRLHLAEVAWNQPGQRVFNVALNGQRVLTHLDIFVEAKGQNKAIVREFTAQADPQGQISLAFRGSQPLPAAASHNPYELTEDYVTTLADDGAGHLLVGHRQQGLEVLSLQTGKRLFPRPEEVQPTDFVTALLPRPDGTCLLAGYGGGLMQTPLPDFPTTTATSAPTVSAPDAAPALPTPANPPTLAELNAMLKTVSAVAPDKQEMQPKVVALDDDWLTEGDWLGRYGRYWACLCAMSAGPLNYIWGAGWDKVDYRTRMGPNHRQGDKLRYYVTSKYTTNPDSLEMPPTYLDSRVRQGLTTPDVYRRQSEADDHGETYPTAMDGPNIYCTVTVPSGLFYLSLYDFNKDGHNNDNRFRDYRISIRRQPSNLPLKNMDHFTEQPELAHSRIRDFWGGVWKRFLVRGPVRLAIEVNRNNSFNTILPAVMLDLVDEDPPPYFHTLKQWKAIHAEKQNRQVLPAKGFTSETEAARHLLNALQQMQAINPAWREANGRRYYGSLLRWYAAKTPKLSAIPTLSSLGTCYYQMGLYASWEECQKRRGLVTARQIEKSLRWDGVTDTDHDYDVVNAYLAAHKSGSNKTSSRQVR